MNSKITAPKETVIDICNLLLSTILLQEHQLDMR